MVITQLLIGYYSIINKLFGYLFDIMCCVVIDLLILVACYIIVFCLHIGSEQLR